MNTTAREVEKTLTSCTSLTSESAKKCSKDLKDKLKQLYRFINEQNMGLAEPWKNASEVKKDLEQAAICIIETQDSFKSVKALLNAK